MTMTVGELKEMIENIPDDVEVRFASQPSWPMEYEADAAKFQEPTADPEDAHSPAEENGVLYLVEGQQLGYLPGEVCKLVGWSDGE